MAARGSPAMARARPPPSARGPCDRRHALFSTRAEGESARVRRAFPPGRGTLAARPDIGRNRGVARCGREQCGPPCAEPGARRGLARRRKRGGCPSRRRSGAEARSGERAGRGSRGHCPPASGGDPSASVRDVAALLGRRPQLLEVAAISGAFAQVLDHDPDAEGCSEYLVSLARSPTPLLRASALLLALAVEASVRAPKGVGDPAGLVAVARDRDYGPGDHGALRRIAAAVARIDAVAGGALGARYALLCAGAFAPSTPHGRPVRSSGRRTRILVLLPAAFAGGRATGIACGARNLAARFVRGGRRDDRARIADGVIDCGERDFADCGGAPSGA